MTQPAKPNLSSSHNEPGCNVSVTSYGASAEYYLEQTYVMAACCAAAMHRGELVEANDFYARGLIAYRSHMHNITLAMCVGDLTTPVKGE